jgi:hypothetical protein
MPEIARVCDEGEGGSIRFRERSLRLSGRCGLFAQRGLVFVQLSPSTIGAVPQSVMPSRRSSIVADEP